MAASRSAPRASTAPAATLRPEPACAGPASSAAAVRTVSAAGARPRRRACGRGVAGPPRSPPSAAAACPAGWFGAGCQTRCSCANDGHCHPATGHCSCAPGWTGRSCERGRALAPALPGRPAPLGCPALVLFPTVPRALLQPVPAGTGGRTAATRATAAPATRAATPSVAGACARPATWARGASSVSPAPPWCAPEVCTRLRTCLHSAFLSQPSFPHSLGQTPPSCLLVSNVRRTGLAGLEGRGLSRSLREGGRWQFRTPDPGLWLPRPS